MATQLNPRVKSALLQHIRSNASRSNTLLHQGFTLVELMIVIVIVGILSAVALPNFLSQTSKAKGTECATKIGAILSQVAAEHQSDPDNAATLLTDQIEAANTDSDLCTFTDAGLTAPEYGVDAVGKGALADKYDAKSCVNADTGRRDIKQATGNAPTAADANCAAPA